ncbi:cytochrome c oxidase assembly protein [Paenactinomyces guangxiensis]|uniref:Cytochrome c oxidase assembly protein n=1 Tax=Paenactinomyces guangxiensis TaxID=1490290 RepID=A0A7W2A8A9_9BACL|nr:cytochrome c oxidase assembly protein [Paenactinomyces guangxiensis]MBA4494465.1 cytochrome c oxidase assembly protein [Paenactinomyces guangxiensis]MBH8591480.1 cytochrome c oxidase assembly protein [Paenactinomyces guangxiensis]
MSVQEFFQLFLFAANWDFKLNLLFLLGAVLYLLFTGPWKRLFPGSEPVPGLTKVYFLLGWIIYYFAMGSPLNLLAHELFSMHMLQMSLLYFAMPPLLILGLPAYMLRPLLKVHWLRVIGKFFTRPLITLFFFNGLISFYHVPVIFDSIMGSYLLHIVSHALLLFAAACMWWPVVGPVPELDRVKPLHKLALIFGNGVLLTPACAIITFTDIVLFDTYAKMSTLVPVMSPIHDQQLGGVIMKIMQEIVYITAIGCVFLQWIRIQRARDEAEMLEWEKSQNPTLQNN